MKKGQISIFIIIGIIVLIALGFVLYVSFVVKESQVEVVREQGFDAVQGDQLQLYLSTCLKDVVRKGIYAVALHGGYLNPVGAREWGEDGDGQPTKSYYILDEQKI